jgi:chromate transporter
MMRLVAEVSLAFAKIGLFTLGGGLAVIALVQQEVLARGWLSAAEFLDILAVAQVTPGPIGVNAATFTGWRTAENAGFDPLAAFGVALFATCAVMLASVVGVLLAGRWFERNRERPSVKSVFAVLRPVVAGAIFAVGLNMVLAVFGAAGENGAKCLYDWRSVSIGFKPLVLCALTFALTFSRRVSPLWGLLAGAIAGIAL